MKKYVLMESPALAKKTVFVSFNYNNWFKKYSTYRKPLQMQITAISAIFEELYDGEGGEKTFFISRKYKHVSKISDFSKIVQQQLFLKSGDFLWIDPNELSVIVRNSYSLTPNSYFLWSIKHLPQMYTVECFLHINNGNVGNEEFRNTKISFSFTNSFKECVEFVIFIII